MVRRSIVCIGRRVSNGVSEDEEFVDEECAGDKKNDSDKKANKFANMGIWADVFARECGSGLSAGGLRRQLSATLIKMKYHRHHQC